MTDRRQLGTGPVRAAASRTPETDLPPVPRAQLAAERLPAVPASEPTRRPTAGRRVLGAGTSVVGSVVAPTTEATTEPAPVTGRQRWPRW